jgi:hypothetical protein
MSLGLRDPQSMILQKERSEIHNVPSRFDPNPVPPFNAGAVVVQSAPSDGSNVMLVQRCSLGQRGRQSWRFRRDIRCRNNDGLFGWLGWGETRADCFRHPTI